MIIKKPLIYPFLILLLTFTLNYYLLHLYHTTMLKFTVTFPHNRGELGPFPLYFGEDLEISAEIVEATDNFELVKLTFEGESIDHGLQTAFLAGINAGLTVLYQNEFLKDTNLIISKP